MTHAKTKLRFSRKMLAIPYALFLVMFVIFPLLLIVFYAFTDASGSFTFINFVVVILTFAILFPIYYHKESIKLRADGSDAKPELPFKRVWLFVILAAASLYLNELFTVYANELDAAIYAPLSNGLNIVCTFILDIVVFKDKITVKKLVGLIIVIAAFILLGF